MCIRLELGLKFVLPHNSLDRHFFRSYFVIHLRSPISETDQIFVFYEIPAWVSSNVAIESWAPDGLGEGFLRKRGYDVRNSNDEWTWFASS